MRKAEVETNSELSVNSLLPIHAFGNYLPFFVRTLLLSLQYAMTYKW